MNIRINFCHPWYFVIPNLFAELLVCELIRCTSLMCIAFRSRIRTWTNVNTEEAKEVHAIQTVKDILLTLSSVLVYTFSSLVPRPRPIHFIRRVLERDDGNMRSPLLVQHYSSLSMRALSKKTVSDRSFARAQSFCRSDKDSPRPTRMFLLFIFSNWSTHF